MRTLVLNHLRLQEMSPVQFFRSCYMWKFDKDIPPHALEEDTQAFLRSVAVPKYIVDYMLHVYGTR